MWIHKVSSVIENVWLLRVYVHLLHLSAGRPPSSCSTLIFYSSPSLLICHCILLSFYVLSLLDSPQLLSLLSALSYVCSLSLCLFIADTVWDSVLSVSKKSLQKQQPPATNTHTVIEMHVCISCMNTLKSIHTN